MALVIFDADDTLWSGLILGGSEAAVVLRPGIPDVLKELKKRGHLVAVCSRNDRANLLGHLARLHLAPHIDQVYADWGPKSTHVATMLADLPPDLPVLFIDDDPFQRAEVQGVHARVTCTFPEDPLDLLDHPLVAAQVTAEDRGRVQLLRDQQARQAAETAYSGGYQAFLASTDLVLTLYPYPREYQHARILDLLNRTNELRTNRQRYDALPQADVLIAAALRDRFGDYGLIAVAVARETPDNWLLLDDMAVSCRTMGRGVGSALIAWLTRKAQQWGHRGLRGVLQETTENATMRALFEFQGFEPRGEGLWELEGAERTMPPWLRVDIPLEGRFHHVGVLVRSEGEALVALRAMTGSAPERLPFERVEAFQCRCAFPTPGIELVVPDPGSRLAKYLDRSETALHHIALLVPDIERDLWDHPRLFPEPAVGARGLLVNFLEPRAGVLVELVANTPAARDLLP